MNETTALPPRPDIRTLLDSVPGPCLLVDQDSTVVAASDAYLQASATRREDILGRDILEILASDGEQASAGPLAIVQVVEDIGAFVRRRRRERELEALNASLREQIVGLETDLAAGQRRGEEMDARLRAADEALERGNRYLQHFAQMAAHDLQSPLYAIAGCTQLLQEEGAGRLSGDAQKYMALVLDNTRRMQILIQDLLAYCRLDADGRPAEVVNLHKVFDEVLFALAKPIAEAGAEVSCGELPTLRVDRSQVGQLLLHLANNAIKFRQAAQPPRVQVWAEERDGEWVFAVQDNGIGIDPKFHEQVFDIFRRLHSYQTYPGSGLGLTVCRRIVERHGGRIWVESRTGEGSIFYFTLPATGGKAA